MTLHPDYAVQDCPVEVRALFDDGPVLQKAKVDVYETGNYCDTD